MLLGMQLFDWLSGLWLKLVIPLSAGEYLIDVNGTALTVGQTAKLVGTIVSLDAVDRHFGGVGLQMIHPSGSQSPVFAETFFVDPSQVVVGS